MRRGMIAFACACAAAAPAFASDLDGDWRVRIDSGRSGPIEARLRFAEENGRIVGRSLSGATALVAALPRAAGRDFGAALLELRLDEKDGRYAGVARMAGREAPAEFTLADGRIEGGIEGTFAAGRVSGAREAGDAPLRDFSAVLDRLDAVVGERLFRPGLDSTEAYRLFRTRMDEIAAAARDDLDLLAGFYYGWTDDPFSHFDLRRGDETAEAMMKAFDLFRVGAPAARLALEDGVAVLDVDTMMGLDTIEQIEAAYAEIAAKGAKALIIDLRGNGGGAFAVKPLVEHVIDEPLDAGAFASRKWAAAHDGPPEAADIDATAPWSGWSLIAFWRTVQENALLRLRLTPAAPNFDGPVFVLVDGDTASAAELAADAFKSSGAAILIGARTQGQMLSQSPFDLSDGYMISLPVADYFSRANGRIEGVGVMPDVTLPPAMALDYAKARAAAAK